MMHLSSYIDEFEQREQDYTRNKCNELILFYENEYGINLKELSKSEDPIYTYNYLKAFLFNKNKEKLYYCLSQIGCNPLEFEKNLIFSVCISMCKGKSNSNVLVSMMEKNKVFNDVLFGNDGWFYIDSSFDHIKCMPATSRFKDNQFVMNMIEIHNKNGTLDSACHEISYMLIKENPNYRAITGIATKGLGDCFYHSVVVDENDMVIDIPNNIVMPREMYLRLGSFKPISEVSYEECVRQNAECKLHDESGTLYPLLRIAAYKQKTSQK